MSFLTFGGKFPDSLLSWLLKGNREYLTNPQFIFFFRQSVQFKKELPKSLPARAPTIYIHRKSKQPAITVTVFFLHLLLKLRRLFSTRCETKEKRIISYQDQNLKRLNHEIPGGRIKLTVSWHCFVGKVTTIFQFSKKIPIFVRFLSITVQRVTRFCSIYTCLSCSIINLIILQVYWVDFGTERLPRFWILRQALILN